MDVNGDPWYIEFIKQRPARSQRKVVMTNILEIFAARILCAQGAQELGLSAQEASYQRTRVAGELADRARMAACAAHGKVLEACGSEGFHEAMEASEQAYRLQQEAFRAWEVQNSRMLDLYKVRQVARESGWGYW